MSLACAGNAFVGGVVVSGGSRVLLCHPKVGVGEEQAWTFPKGLARPGEAVRQAAIRAVYEKTGYMAEILDGMRGPLEGSPGPGRYFLMDASPGSPGAALGTETLRWIPFEEARALILDSPDSDQRKRDLALLTMAEHVLDQRPYVLHPKVQPEDWQELKPMSERHAILRLPRRFTPEEMTRIRRGFFPTTMEQRWFIYLSGERLRFHRSWTGHLIYDVGFEFDSSGGASITEVVVTRDPELLGKCDDEADLARLEAVITVELLDPLNEPADDYFIATSAKDCPAEQGMKACIRRGSHQIGGSCIELQHGETRLLLDLGLPLDAIGDGPEQLPGIRDFREEGIAAVLVSHAHLDHCGLLHHLPAGIPVIMGDAAKAILRAAAPFTGRPSPALEGPSLRDREPLEIGPFRITPFLMDHSAYDAYALLIEAGGRRLLYSGDFRGHGRKRALFERLVAEPPAGVHALLMEGSSLSRLDDGERFESEQALEEAFVGRLTSIRGLALVLASAQNIDRVVTLFRAARRSGRELVIDLYAAAILAATGNRSIPQSDWTGVRLYVPEGQRRQIVRNQLFAELERHGTRRIYADRLARDAQRYVLLFRPLHKDDLDAAGALDGAELLYSQWMGYWRGHYAGTADWIAARGIPFHYLHTSGHADPHDLRRFVTGIAPERLVPIHSFAPEKFGSLFPAVEPRADGEWWDV